MVCLVFWTQETYVGRQPEITQGGNLLIKGTQDDEPGWNMSIPSVNITLNEMDSTSTITIRNTQNGNYSPFVMSTHSEDCATDRLFKGRNSSSEPPNIVIAVMGEASYFSEWYSRLKIGIHSRQLSFVYGAFDSIGVSDENDRECKEQVTTRTHFRICRFYYIPNTTWTQGRNLLASHIVRIEEQQHKEFDYWIFSDEDIELDCSLQTGGTQSERGCWRHLLYQLYESPRVLNEKITQFTVPPRRQVSRGGWSGVSTYDAYLAGFSRSAVPYLMPYATPESGDSEWISQAIIFCVTQTCFPSSVALIPDIFAYNARHRDYQRDRFSPETVRSAIYQNMGGYVDLNKYCTHENYRHMQDRIGTFASLSDLEVALPPTKFTVLCEPLALRFQDWVRRTLSAQ